jgi:hypothetical protein
MTVARRQFHATAAQGGFVLLVTLVLLMIAALAMVAICRAAILRTQAADESEAQLQRHWGSLSCQTALLPKAEILLQRLEEQSRQSVSNLRQVIQLGNQRFDLILADESAKANVATIMNQQGKDQAELSIRQLCLSSPDLAGNVHLRWEPDPKNPPHPDSFGDVFENSNPASLCDDSQGAAAAQILTCWGDGRTNIRRASEDVLKQVCQGILNLSQIHEIVELRTSDPQITLAQCFKRMQLNDQTQSAAMAVLTDTPTCYSLWINCHSSRRSDWSLLVGERQNGNWSVAEFSW